MGSLLLTTIRQLGAGIVFCVFLLIRNTDTVVTMLRDTDTARRLAIFGTFGLFLNSVLYAATISHTNAGTATVLQSLCIVLALLVTCVRTPRIPRPLEICALVSALAAIFLIATHADPSSLKLPVPGLVLGLLCACAATFYTMYPKLLFERWGSFLVTGLGMLQGGVTGLVVCIVTGRLAEGIPIFDVEGWLVLAIAILFGISTLMSLLGGLIIPHLDLEQIFSNFDAIDEQTAARWLAGIMNASVAFTCLLTIGLGWGVWRRIKTLQH
jgi:drug/metabolite transporter (DMT)-like permease